MFSRNHGWPVFFFFHVIFSILLFCGRRFLLLSFVVAIGGLVRTVLIQTMYVAKHARSPRTLIAKLLASACFDEIVSLINVY